MSGIVLSTNVVLGRNAAKNRNISVMPTATTKLAYMMCAPVSRSEMGAPARTMMIFVTTSGMAMPSSSTGMNGNGLSSLSVPGVPLVAPAAVVKLPP